MHTAEPVYTREATEMIVKNIYSTYVKSYHEQLAANATQLNSEDKTQLLGLINDFDGLFDGTLEEWDT